MTTRGIFTNGPSTAAIDKLMDQLQDAIRNGDNAEAAALQAQIDEVRAQAEQAEETGQNARDMVLRRDPRLTTLEDLATDLAGAVDAGNNTHQRLDQRIDDIQLTPGPTGPPGPTGADGAHGRDGADSTVPGPAGPAGHDGKDSTTPGPQGPKGDTGATGSVGPTGPIGATGTRGDAGPAGPQGPKGDTGPAGPTNLQIEYRDGIAVPAVLSLLGSAATVDIPITWTNPLPDTNYMVTVQCTPVDSTLIGKTAVTVKSKTANGIVATVTTTALLSVAGKCVLSAVAYRKG
jgi:hypothetical protein